jgi:hypothetical protein
VPGPRTVRSAPKWWLALPVSSASVTVGSPIAFAAEPKQAASDAVGRHSETP